MANVKRQQLLTVFWEWRPQRWWTTGGAALWWSPARASCWWRRQDRPSGSPGCTTRTGPGLTSPWWATGWWAFLQQREECEDWMNSRQSVSALSSCLYQQSALVAIAVTDVATSTTAVVPATVTDRVARKGRARCCPVNYRTREDQQLISIRIISSVN